MIAPRLAQRKQRWLLLPLWTLSFMHASAQQTKARYEFIGDSLIKAGQAQFIIPFFEQEAKRFPKDEHVRRALGFQYLQEGRLDEGEAQYRAALRINPACGRCYMNLARASATRNHFPAALARLDSAIAIDPNDAAAYALRAEIRMAADHDKIGALADFNKAVSLDPADPGVLTARGRYNLSQGYAMLAGADARAALQADTTWAPGWALLGEVYFGEGRFSEAEQAYTQAIVSGSATPTLHVYRSEARYAQEKLDESCADLHAAMQLMAALPDPDTAMRRYLSASVGTYCDSAQPSFYYQRGVAAYNLGKPEDAVAVYSRGLRRFPDNAMSRAFRGNAYLALGDYAGAIADYRIALTHTADLRQDVARNPKFADQPKDSVEAFIAGHEAASLLSMAESYAALGRYDSALTAIDQGIARAPEISLVQKHAYYNLRGAILLNLDRRAEALADFDEAIRRSPRTAMYYANRAIAKLPPPTTKQRSALRLFLQTQQGGGTATLGWALPAIRKSRDDLPALQSALEDCNAAIAIGPREGLGYYVRATITAALGESNPCADVRKAAGLGYPVDEATLSGCR